MLLYEEDTGLGTGYLHSKDDRQTNTAWWNFHLGNAEGLARSSRFLDMCGVNNDW